MKKKFMMGALCALVFSACQETEITTVDISGTATINGVLLANTDRVNTPDSVEPLEGIEVSVSWDPSDLSISSTGNTPDQILTTTTDTEGQFTFELPSTQEDVSYEVFVNNVETDVTYHNGIEDITFTGIFESLSNFVTLRNDETQFVELSLDDDLVNDDFTTNIDGLRGSATIFGNVVAETDLLTTFALPENVSGLLVSVNTSEGILTTTTNATGDYSIEVPVSVENSGDNDFTVTFADLVTTLDYNNGLQDQLDFPAVFEGFESQIQNLEAGEERELTFAFDTGDLEQELPFFATIEGTFQVLVDDEENEVDGVSGADIMVRYFDEFGIQRFLSTITTDSAGFYSIEVQVNTVDDYQLIFPTVIIDDYITSTGNSGIATYNTTNNFINNLSAGSTRVFNVTDFFPDTVITEN